VGAGTARLHEWAELESKLVRSVCLAQDVLPKHIRVDIVMYIAGLADVARLPKDKMFTALALLDLACLRLGHAAAGAKLLELSCALVNVLKKTDSARYVCPGSEFMQRARGFAESCSNGDMHTNLGITMQGISKAEWTLMSALQWQTRIPSLQQWLQLFVTRFTVLCPHITQHLEWLHQMTIHYARQIAFKQVTYKELCPRDVAQGLFCTGLALARILPIDSFCPAGVDKASWEAQVRSLQVWPGGQAPRAPSLVPTEVATCFLQLTTDTPMKDLQSATQRSICFVRAPVVSCRWTAKTVQPR